MKKHNNMKKSFLFFALAMAFLLNATYAQDEAIVTLNSAANGTTASMVETPGGYLVSIISENLPSGDYDDGPFDRSVTVQGNCDTANLEISLYFDQFDIDPGDTLFIYDGPSTSSPVLAKSNNNYNSQYHRTVFPSMMNTTNKLTIRFKTNGDGKSGAGFSISVRCRDKCETVVPVIDSFYYKTKNGVIIDTAYTRDFIQVDTSWSGDSTSYTLDTQYFTGVHLCLGEGVIFNGHGQYTNYYGYGPSDISSMFEWNFGNGDDTSGIGLKMAPARYRDLDCYDVTLRITDIKGCNSTIMESVRVRISQNPIKTIFPLNPICTTDSAIVNIGYGGDNASITMQYLEFAKAKSRTIDCRTFIPDGKGKHCPQADDSDPDCFKAPIYFDDFPSGRVVQSAEDICSICINYEHSYMGDYRLSIRCPSGETAVLKYADYYHESGLPPEIVAAHDNQNDPKAYLMGGVGGGGTLTGVPYDGQGDYDRKCSPEPYQDANYCDTTCNMYGEGMDYCFSRNGDYILASGKKANTSDFAASDFIATQDWFDEIQDYTFPTIPAPYATAGYTASPKTVRFKRPSNHEEKTNYYLPVSDLSDLEGCPLNGDWSIVICDYWPADNGWVFSWSLDFCGISAGGGCEYQVGIDSVIWEPDSAYGDFDLGYWRGLSIEKRTDIRSIISSHDTAGYFPINVRIYDEFGCEWDTTTSIQAVWSPTPELGDDRLICDVESITLDAKDRHVDSNYTFAWEPFGQKTDTVHTSTMMGSSTLYTVDVTHKEHDITCTTRDSVRVNINHQPLPNFDPGVYPLEGCEPYTIHFENTSQYGDYYFWDFGDGDTSNAKSPTHTFGTGQYNFRYIVRTKEGCQDSLVYEDLITVYSSPVAQFSWEPMNPTVMHPEVTFNNLTIPQSDANRYYWEIQYDRDNHISYHTLTDVNPTFEWETDGSDISGNYVVRLIAMTENMGPSGNIVQCRDTIENSILLVNDFLQFPNAVTPNGDGVNDKFIIRNLIEGLGYPNNSLAIYDRWGKRIFYKENISKEEDFWDPAKDNVPTGTYFWRFTGKGYLGDIQRNGVVEIIK